MGFTNGGLHRQSNLSGLRAGSSERSLRISEALLGVLAAQLQHERVRVDGHALWLEVAGNAEHGFLARSEHDVGRVADRQLAAFELAAGGRSVDDAVLRSVSEAAAAVGIEPGSDEARELARRLSEVELGG